MVKKFNFHYIWVGGEDMKKEFIERVNKIAQEGYKEYGILPSLTIAQSILESAWGKSHIRNNIFGIKKGSSWKGKTRLVTTTEYIGGRKVVIKDEFRVYDSIEDSIRDYLKLIGQLSRYRPVRKAKDYKEACYKVYESGYATDPNYSKKLIKIIEENSLYRYDKNPKKLHTWGEEAWNWARENKITDGTEPDRLASREEVITFLFRYRNKK